MGQVNELKDFTRGQLDAALMKIGQDVGMGTAEGIRAFLCGELVISKVAQAMENFLEFIATTVIPSTTGKFIAREKFVVDRSRKAKVKIRYLGVNFTQWFLSGDGKIENPIGEQTLRYAKLKKSSVDAPIIAELGGEEKSETALSSVYGLMEQQPSGEEGALLTTNGYANIFYVRDRSGVLRAVIVHWHDVGWDVHARSVASPVTWLDGRRVFSLNSVLDPSATVSAQA